MVAIAKTNVESLLPLCRITLRTDQLNSTANTGSAVLTYTGTLNIDNAVTTYMQSKDSSV